MINVRVDLLVRPGKRRELLQSICDLKNKIASEVGCSACEVFQNPDNPDDFVLLERWDSEEQARAHVASENLALLVGAGSVLSQRVNVSLFRDPTISEMERHFRKRIMKRQP